MSEHDETVREISLSDIFWSLWSGRGIIVLVPVLAIGLALVYIFVVTLTLNRPVTYLVNLRNIENQRYPNGAAFSPQDLLIPEVLAELRRRFDISADADLRQSISVAYASPIAEGISRSYQERLSNRNLTQAEIAALNQSYLEELNAAMRASLRISVDYREIGLDSATGVAVAAALPQIWTEIYTTRFRIFTDRRIADLAVTRTREDLATSASVLVTNARIDAMRSGVEILIEDNRLSLLRTAEGISPADLDIELRRFATIWFNAIKASRLQEGDTVASAYLTQLRLDIAERQRRVQAYDMTLAELREYQRVGQPAPQFPSDQPQFGDRNTLQLGESALSEIVQLAEQASFASFVQEVLRSRRQLMFDISDLTRELELADSEEETVVTSAEFRAQAAEMLEELTRQYSELVAAASEQLRDRGGELFQPALGPLINDASPISLRNAMIIAMAAIAGGFLAIVFVLLRSSIRPRRA